MLSEELPKQIELLVDTLRKQRSTTLSLTDVASVTEVLIATMQAFFRSIDTSIYRECRALSEYITNARKEIASLQPGDLEDARIPRAGLELDAIVQQTETATNTIMEAAEEIMGLDPSDTETFQTTVQDNILKIFEACSFQDITGQRIQKVVETLSHIEERVLELRDLLGVTTEDIQEARENEDPVSEEKALLSGPALEGEGIDQTAVDELMDEAGPASGPPGPAPVEQPAPPPPPPAPSAPAPAAAAPAPPPPAPEPVDPAVLDNMFEEDFDPNAEIAAASSAAEEDKKKAEEEAAKKKAEADKAAAAATAAAAARDDTAAASSAEDDQEIDLGDKEEVSQDDIDALFG